MPVTTKRPLSIFFQGLLLPLVLLSCNVAFAAAPEISYFSKPTEFQQIKISPDGKHLAVLGPADGKKVLIILETEGLKFVSIARFDDTRQVGEFHWANNDRLIIKLEYFRAWFEQPESAGEWFALNVNGWKGKYIFGYRPADWSGAGSASADATYGYGSLVDLLPDEKKYVLMSSEPFGRSEKAPALYRLNIYTGRKRMVTRSPVTAADFLTDHQGRPRFITGVNSLSKLEVYYRNTEEDDWHSLPTKSSEEEILPVAFLDENRVYTQIDPGHGTKGVYILDLKTGEREKVYSNEQADPSSFRFTNNGRALFAMEYETPLPAYVFVDEESRDAKLLRSLMAAFPGQQARLESETEDGQLAIIKVFSDRDPGTFFLFDRKAVSVRPLAKARPWVDPELSASLKPIEFTSRDGKTIRGLLTIPAHQEAKNLPLVVLPHGGPHFVRDHWGYDGETQLLASRGMAVLQVNFRGSSGYGNNFEAIGYRHWGDTVQYDIIDGTRYLIEQGIVDENRICIYGASFGAYSAMQSSILEPELFACAAGFVGVYDLGLMHELGDVQSFDRGEAYLDIVIGKDQEELRAFSPVHNADKLTTPVLLIHGEEDERAPIEHAEAMRNALQAKGRAPEWVVMKKEGHGFYNDRNREDMYRTLLRFLEKHLKLEHASEN